MPIKTKLRPDENWWHWSFMPLTFNRERLVWTDCWGIMKFY